MTDEEIKKVNNFQISIYGYNENTYKNATGVNLFTNVDRFIHRLENMRIVFDISFLANSIYLKEFQEYNRFIKSIKYRKLILGTADNQGRYANSKVWQLSNEEKTVVEKLFDEIRKDDDINKKYNDQHPNHCQAGNIIIFSERERRILSVSSINE